MCLMILAHQVSTDYPLLVAANRDEYHSRPTAASDFWRESPQLLAGRDLSQGGTWMGVTRSGRFAAVTNFRDPSRTAAAPRSRGVLPLAFLLGSQAPEEFLCEVAGQGRLYAGFNLLVGDSHSLWYFSNSDAAQPRVLPAGLYGLSNASLDTPWPKVELGKSRLRTLLANEAVTHESLQAVVSDRQLAGARASRDHGLEGSMDRVLSAQFIVTGAYGTRSSTTLWIDARARLSWRETTFDAQGEPLQVQRKDFTIGGD